MTKHKKSRISFNRRMLGCYNAIKICITEKHLYQASALTFSSLLAIVPIVTVSIYLSTLLPVFDEVILALKNYILNNYIPAAGDSIQQYLQKFASHAATLPVGYLFFLCVTVGMLVHLIKSTMNDIWHSPDHESVWSQLIGWTVLVSMPLLVGFSVFSSHYLLSLEWVDYTISHLGMSFLLSTLIPVFINIFAFTLLYYFAPNCTVRVSDSIFGAVTAAVLFEIAKRFFEFYFRHSTEYDVIYGSLATIPIFMIWLYISWSIIIYGAIVVYAQNQQRIL